MTTEITEVPADGSFRRFVLSREEDVSGVSGTGVVAHGVEFPDGTVVLRWTVGAHHSTVNWSSIDSVIAIHGHDGRTSVEWVDDVAGLSDDDHKFDTLLAEVLATGIGEHTRQVLNDLRELASQWRAQGIMRSMDNTVRAECGRAVLEILDRQIPDKE